MSLDAKRDVAALERLSALVDGELGADAAAQACGHWREDAEARVSWHAYHVIGDVLRSDDLAADPARDAAFLKSLRARLDTEPVVLAPQRPAVPTEVAGAPRRRGWRATSALAAGFVAVVGVTLLTTRGTGDAPAVASLAQIQPVAASAAGAVAEPPALVANGKLIRDARLDRYLAAHKQFAGSSALGVPSGYLRNATASESGR